mgnify:CR=1 FL=1
MKFNINNYKRYIAVLWLITAITASGQQDPVYTQYNFNTQTINPAYAGTWERMGFLFLGRHQWIGMEGAPQTYTFSFQTNTSNDKVGLGLNLISDQIGRENRLSLFGDYSYGLRVGEESMLRFGLKAGVTNYKNNLLEYIQYPGEPDPAVLGDTDMRYLPNFGVGTFLNSSGYYIGFSIPKMIENDFDHNYNNYSTQVEVRHFYLMGGYVLPLSENLQFKPTFLALATTGAPLEFDFSANFLLGEKVWLGAMYRTGESFGFIAQWIFENNLRIGYAVDFTTSELQTFNNGAHEVMVSYEIALEKKKKWSSPRMF